MFSGFRVEITKDFWGKDYCRYLRAGARHLKEQRMKCDETLEKYEDDEILSARKVALDWFPEIEADVFISHSRLDKCTALAFAGWLSSEFQLRCFVDSNVWNHVNKLIQVLGRKLHFSTIFSRNYWNQEFGHSYMMLAMALMRMIDKAEAVFLLNAGNAMPESNITYSPWIFAEVTATDLIRKKPLAAYREYPAGRSSDAKEKFSMLLENYCVSYELDLDNLISLSYTDLKKWKINVKKQWYDYPLDALYEITEYEDDLHLTMALARCCPEEAERIRKDWNRVKTGNMMADRGAPIQESIEGAIAFRKYLNECRQLGKCPMCMEKCVILVKEKVFLFRQPMAKQHMYFQ